MELGRLPCISNVTVIAAPAIGVAAVAYLREQLGVLTNGTHPAAVSVSVSKHCGRELEHW